GAKAGPRRQVRRRQGGRQGGLLRPAARRHGLPAAAEGDDRRPAGAEVIGAKPQAAELRCRRLRLGATLPESLALPLTSSATLNPLSQRPAGGTMPCTRRQPSGGRWAP